MARVLLCDHDPFFLKTMEDYLALYGFQVIPIDQSTQAMATLRAGSYDLFICNRWMPQADGLRLVEEIRASEDPTLQKMRILLFASEDLDMKERQYLRRLGVSMISKYQPVSRWVNQIQTMVMSRA